MKKTKKKIKSTKKVSSRRVQARNFEAHYLAIILVVFLLLEGYFVSSTQLADWQKGMRVLDISTAVTQTTTDISLVMQPVTDAVKGVDQFYQLSATAMIELFDMSQEGPGSQIGFVTDSVYEFYQQASIETASLLDVSSVSAWPSQVAGVSVSIQ